MRTTLRPLLFLSLAALTGLTGCLEMAVSTKDKIVNLARQYGDDIRWSRIEVASRTVGAARRAQFVEQHKALEDDLEFADFELLDVEVEPKQQKAISRVDYTWTRKRQGLLQKTTTEQTWEYQSGNWVLTKESRLRGAPLVLFDEPRKEANASAPGTDRYPAPR